jgi:RHS repeat-associated protein
VTTKYLVDDRNPTGYLQVLEEVSGGSVQVAYTYGTSVVSQRRSSGTSYYGYDAHGNVSFLTDATGAVTDSYDYDAYGNLVASSGSTQNTRLYAGEEFDADLGLISLRARYYEPGRGRFATIDAFEPGSTTSPLALNRYLYGNSDPTNRRDPLGLFAGGEYASMVATGPTRVVVATAPAAGAGSVAAGAAGATSAVAGSTGFIVGQKLACTFQNAADEFAAVWGEDVVRADPKCPLYRCVCQCTPIPHTPGYDDGSPAIPDDDEPGGPFVPGRPEIPPPPKKPVKGTALGDSVQTASVRCLIDVHSKFAFEAWNLDGWYEPDDCAIQNCWPIP